MKGEHEALSEVGHPLAALKMKIAALSDHWGSQNVLTGEISPPVKPA